MKKVKELYSRIPAVVRTFLWRALAFFIGWQALYHFVLAPRRVPDIALTNFATWSTQKILSVFYDGMVPIYIRHYERDAFIYKNGYRVVAIGDPCNALEIFVLYTAFLLCFPGSAKRRLAFLAVGLPCIHIFNAIRIALISWMNISHPGWVDISHHYIFTTAMYLMVFGAWVLYTRKDESVYAG